MEINASQPDHKKYAALIDLKREVSIRSNYEKIFTDISAKKDIINGNGIPLDMKQKKEIAKILAASMPLR